MKFPLKNVARLISNCHEKVIKTKINPLTYDTPSA